MKIKSMFFALLFIPTMCFTQIPTIKAVGGDGIKVDWSKAIAEYDKNNVDGGPDFFYNDCDQGLEPLKASSTLAPQGKYNYKVSNLMYGDPRMAWVEGVKGYGIGEWFEVKGLFVNTLANGYQLSPTTWINNSRVKKFKVYVDKIPLCYLELTDEMGYQRFHLPDTTYSDTGKVFRFEIVDVYKGLKWDDVAISSVGAIGCCFLSTSLIQTEFSDMLASDINKNDGVLSVDIDKNEVFDSKVLIAAEQKHVVIYKISTAINEISITIDHPLNFEGYGFTNLKTLLGKQKIESLNDSLSVLIWDNSTKSSRYEKILKIEKQEGLFETKSILKLDNGNTYIVNGFISKTY